MKTSHRLVLFSYNFSSVLSFKYIDHSFEISRTQSIMNCFMLPLSIIFTFLLFSSRQLQDKLIDEQASVKETITIISGVTIIFSNFSTMITTLTICFVNLGRQKRILIFLNSARNFRYRMREEIDERFLKKLKKVSLLVNLIIFMFVIMQFSYMKKSLLSFVPILLILYPISVFINFLAFVKSFEFFFSALLRNFRMEVEETLLSKSNMTDIVQLMRHYNEIYKLNQEFINLFGIQLTAVTCCSSIMTTVDVSVIAILKIDEHILFSVLASAFECKICEFLLWNFKCYCNRT